jgi:hypothetical protein
MACNWAKSIRAQEGLAAVLFSFLDRFPRDRHERALEEGIVYDVLFVIFACNAIC